MESKWKEYELGEITKWASGGTPPKGNPEAWAGDIPWISASSMNGNRYSDSKLKITKLGLKNSRLAIKNSILLLVRGSILHQKIRVGITEKDVAFNQDVKSLVANEEIVDPWFLLFWFMSKEKELLGKVENTGIGAGKLDTQLMQKLSIKIPPCNERKIIVSIFKTIDDKIELNRQMNQTLEQMAQALFKSWFVNFDHVIDNALATGMPIPEELQAKACLRQSFGRQAEKRKALGSNRKPLPEEIQKLFPNEFEYREELEKWVPLGWRIGQISDLSDKIQNGGTPRRNIVEYWGNGTIPWLTSGEVRQTMIVKAENKITQLGLDKSSAKWLPKGATVIALYGATAGQVAYLSTDLTTNQAVCGIIPKKRFQYYNYLNLTQCVKDFENLATGSAQQNISKGVVESLKALIPHNEVIYKFEKQCLPLFNKWEQNIKSNEELSNLRNTLLPKLISGEVRV